MLIRPLVVVVPLALVAAACSHPNASPPSLTAADMQARTAAQDRLDEAAALLTRVRFELPTQVTSSARCVAVVPGMVKGGLVVGARHGNGYAACRTTTGWSAPAPITVSGGSFGAQVGVESVDVVMALMSDTAKKDLASAKLKLGVDVSAAAGPVGKGREAETDVALKAEVLSYSWARGLFAGAELNGAVIEQDAASTTAVYGAQSPTPLRAILSGEVPPPPSAQHFLDAVEEAFPGAPAATSAR